MSVIFTLGINEEGTVSAVTDFDGNLKIHTEGSSNILTNLDMEGIRAMTVLFYGPNVAQPPINIAERPSLIFNQISDPDSHKTALSRCETLCDQLKDIPVINKPSAVRNTTRNRTSMLLQGIPGVLMPKVIRKAPKHPTDVFDILAAENMRLPVIQRTIGQHNAEGMVVINSKADIDKLHVFPFDGREFIFTEFHDFKNSQGIYHTQRIVLVDGEPYLRHALFLDNWKVNSASKQFMINHPEFGTAEELLNEIEKNRLPKAKPAFREIAKRLQLDYFGIDCSIDENGEFLVFEANANMNILFDPPHAIFKPTLPIIKTKIREMMERKAGDHPLG